MGYLEGWARLDGENKNYVCEAAQLLKRVAEKSQWFMNSFVGLDTSHARFLNGHKIDALRSYTIAASSGSELAQLNAAFLLLQSKSLHGDIVSSDEALNNRLAFSYLESAQSQGSIIAMKWMAKCYMELWVGVCDEINMTLARSLLVNATNRSSVIISKSNSETYFLLGQMQYLGSGGPVNTNEALENFQKCFELDRRCYYAALSFRVMSMLDHFYLSVLIALACVSITVYWFFERR